jgi:hypothetical protein
MQKIVELLIAAVRSAAEDPTLPANDHEPHMVEIAAA